MNRPRFALVASTAFCAAIVLPPAAVLSAHAVMDWLGYADGPMYPLALALCAFAGLAAVCAILLAGVYRRDLYKAIQQQAAVQLRGADRRIDELLLENRHLTEELTELRQEESEFQRTRERFELAVKGSKDGLWDWDVATNIVYFSPTLKAMIGYEDHEMQNRFEELESRLHPEDHDRVIRTVQEYFEGTRSEYEIEYRMRHKDGSYRWILARGVALRDVSGRPYRMAGSHVDVTARRAFEERLGQERNLLRTLMDNIPDYVYFKDAESRIITTNAAHLGALGARSLDEVVGKTDFDFFPGELAQQYYADEQAVVRSGQPLVDRVERVLATDGSLRWFLTCKVPIRDGLGAPIGLVGISRDVTAQRMAEEAMQRAKEAAEEANRAKSEFLANMSHEIRTPMNGILGLTELTLDTKLTAEQREYLTMVKASADSLLTVINDILDFSKIEAHQLQLDRVGFSLRDLMGDTMKALAMRAQQKGLELACHIPPNLPDGLVGDPGRLRQVLINLVGNAIKFTEDGEVVVRVEAQPPAADPKHCGLRFSVSDTGIGIPKDTCERIFDAFAQADTSTTRKYGGTGLGLAIAAQLVELMEGRIGVESVEGRGSVFHFTACFGLCPDEAMPKAPAPAVSLVDLPVLVVDDNATNRRIFEEILLNWRMRPRVVDGAAAALAALARAAGEPYALVLLDAHMPEIDGFELARRIQQDHALHNMALLMLTSAGRSDDVARCRDLGIDAYLTKPVKQSELLDAMLTALGHRGRQVRVEPPAALPVVPPDLRVLVAEDNSVNQRLTIELLQRHGVATALAKNGREAVDAVRREAFDLVLMDIQMPILDGLEATAAIRQSEQETGRHVPIIAMTAHAMKGDRERCLAAGMDGYVSKPIRAQELLDAVLRHAPARAAAASDTETPPATIDLDAALALVGGDASLLRELAGLFLESYPQQQEELVRAMQSGDAKAAARAAHTLKSSLSTLGAKPIARLAQHIEIALSQGDLPGAAPLVDRLREALTALEPAMRSLQASSPG